MAGVSSSTSFGSKASAGFVVALFICLSFYLLYRWALPKPIPGIPYNLEAGQTVLGDFPSVRTAIRNTGQIRQWLSQQPSVHQSPIVQVFPRPFMKPWVLICDFRESQDILLHRTKEFDRSHIIQDTFSGLTPAWHFPMKSTDKNFKANRALLKDLMTPRFLSEVEAPLIYKNVETMIKLWSLKTGLARGRPFEAAADVYNVTLDTVFAATFGLDPKDSTTGNELQHLIDYTSRQPLTLPESTDSPVEFPTTHRPETFEAIMTLVESLETAVKSPRPRIAHWILRCMPRMRRAREVKEDLLRQEVEKGAENLIKGDLTKRTALGDILQREQTLAQKEGRPPSYHSRAIYDELFGFLIAGHDSSTTTLSWGVKHLATAAESQSNLRSKLRSAFSTAAKEQRNPNVNEITSTQIPYLDAYVEEIVRVAAILPGVPRTAMVDTTILGYAIPKDTNVWLLQTGPGYFAPPIPVSDSRRSQSSLEAKEVRAWNPDPEEMKKFYPERWLIRDEKEQEIFSAQAGPNLNFGLGPRSCFGKRLAHLQLRIIIVLIIWNFELLPCPTVCSSFGAVDRMVTQPRQTYVRLRETKC